MPCCIQPYPKGNSCVCAGTIHHQPGWTSIQKLCKQIVDLRHSAGQEGSSEQQDWQTYVAGFCEHIGVKYEECGAFGTVQNCVKFFTRVNVHLEVGSFQSGLLLIH